MCLFSKTVVRVTKPVSSMLYSKWNDRLGLVAMVICSLTLFCNKHAHIHVLHIVKAVAISLHGIFSNGLQKCVNYKLLHQCEQELLEAWTP